MSPRLEIAWRLLGLLLLVPYGVATIAPSGGLWGFHALGFLGVWARIIGLATGIGLLLVPSPLWSRIWPAPRRPLHETESSAARFTVLAFLAFLTFYVFSMRTDIYGDARTILKWNADNVTFPIDSFRQLFDLRLLAHREALTLFLHRMIAHAFALDIAQTYRIVSAASGAGCLLMWILYLRREPSGARWATIVFVSACLLGANQIYFGHIETYPFASLVSLCFLLAASFVLSGRAPLWIALAMFAIAIKSHPALLYFLPALLFVVVHRLGIHRASWQRLLSWRMVTAWLVVPSIVLAAWLYVFYFKSHNEPHAGAGREIAHSFLPLVPAPPPLDRYTLLSGPHLLDFLNVLFLVGMPALAGVIGVLLFHRRAVDWRHPRVVFASLAIAYPLLFFFGLNPALTMPRDWDLYALMGWPLLFFFATLLVHSNDRVAWQPVLASTMAFGVFTVAACALNATPGPLSRRLEAIGEHSFRNYHVGSSYVINMAQSMEPDTVQAIARRIATIERLAPWRVGEDGEYAHLLFVLGQAYVSRKQFDQGAVWLERATATTPQNDAIRARLADCYLKAGRSAEAKASIRILLENHPARFDVLIQAAIAAEMSHEYPEALGYLRRAERIRPKDPMVASWIASIEAKAQGQD